MAKEKKQCGGIEDYQWLVVLVLEAVVKVAMALFNKEKPSERRKGSADARKTK